MLLGFMLSATGCGQDMQLPRLTQDATILAFGDSLTYGTGAEQQASYPTILAQITGRNVVNAGKPGQTSEQGWARYTTSLEKTRPDLVILCMGGNDFLQKLPEAKTRANLSAMIEETQARHIPIILVAVPPPRIMLSAHPMYRELAAQYNIPLEDDIIADVLSEKNLKADLAHPNAAGYRLIAEAIADLLKKTGAI